jgi:hypothetical protein
MEVEIMIIPNKYLNKIIKREKWQLHATMEGYPTIYGHDHVLAPIHMSSLFSHDFNESNGLFIIPNTFLSHSFFVIGFFCIKSLNCDLTLIFVTIKV